MDFAAQLAKLERSAANATRGRNGNSGNGSNNNSSNSGYNNNYGQGSGDRRRGRSSSSDGYYNPHRQNQYNNQRNTRPRINENLSNTENSGPLNSSAISSTQHHQQQQGRYNGGGQGNGRSGMPKVDQQAPYRGGAVVGGAFQPPQHNHRGSNSSNTSRSPDSRNPTHRNHFHGHFHGQNQNTSQSHTHSLYNTPSGSMAGSGSRPPPLSGMVRFGYNVTPFPHEYVPILPDVDADLCNHFDSPRSIPHLCLLAITIDDLPFEHLWKHWAMNGRTSRNNDSTEDQVDKLFDQPCYVSLICHAKHPERVTSPWLRNRLLLDPPVRGRGKNTLSEPSYHTRRPEWGSPEITRAMIDLLQQGMAIGQTASSGNTASRSTGATGSTPNYVTDGGELTIAELMEIDPRYSTSRFIVAEPVLTKNNRSVEASDSDGDNSSSCNSESSNEDESLNESDDNDSTKGKTFCVLPSSKKSRVKKKSRKTDNVANVSNITNAATIKRVPPVDKFIFISETCIPVQTLKEFCKLLFPPKNTDRLGREGQIEVDKTKKSVTNGSSEAAVSTAATTFENTVSWVNGFNRTFPGKPKNKYEYDQFAEINAVVPGQYRWKADQWMCLSRLHAHSVLKIDGTSIKPLWKSFMNINASDEMYFPTALALLGILEQDANPNTDNTNNSSNMKNSIDNNNIDKMSSPSSKTLEETSDEKKIQQQESHAKHLVKVLKRSVTYTDWSEGMRNPAMFSRGIRDLMEVGPKAREQQSLIARKFSLWPPSAATTSNSNNTDPPEEAPGYISCTQWDEAMEKFCNIESKK